MENIQLALKMVFILSLLGGMGCGVVHKVRAYRFLVFIAVASISFGVGIEYGLVGILAIAFSFGILVPALILVIVKFVIWMTWRSVRRAFPEEPKRPPASITLSGVYRSMWLA